MKEKVRSNFTMICFPFVYDKDKFKANSISNKIDLLSGQPYFEKLYTKLNDDQDKKHLNTKYLKRNVVAMLDKESFDSGICYIYRFNKESRAAVNLPPINVELEIEKNNAHIEINNIDLYCFETDIAILAIEIKHNTDNIDTIINNNYLINHFSKGNNNELVYKTSCEAYSFTTCDLAQKLLCLAADVEKEKLLDVCDDFDLNEGLNYIDNKPLVFSYILLDKKIADKHTLFEKIFQLRSSYDITYMVPQVLNVDDNIINYFGNSYWGVSSNGVVNLSYLTGEKNTDEFFLDDCEDNFMDNLRNTYFPLYMLSLNMRYTIQTLYEEFSKLSKYTVDNKIDDIDEIEKNMYKVMKIEKRTNLFQLRCIIDSPSSNEHVNLYYKLLTSSFAIDSSFYDFKDRLAQVKYTSQSINDRINNTNALSVSLSKLKADRVLFFWSSVVGTVTSSKLVIEIFSNLCTDKIMFIKWYHMVIIASLILPICIAIPSFVSKTKEINKIKQRIPKKRKNR